jgi:hypothetical protein
MKPPPPPPPPPLLLLLLLLPSLTGQGSMKVAGSGSNRTWTNHHIQYALARHNATSTFGWGSARQPCAGFHLPPSKYNPSM